MNIKLPAVIQKYVDASNRHDVGTIVSCFSDDAVVYDEKQDYRGIRAIEDWIRSTIEKYNFQFKPLSAKGDGPSVTVVTEVSGTFDGSPVTLDYHFAVESNKISSLAIE
jgi:ketosteroid isomerase-like protein